MKDGRLHISTRKASNPVKLSIDVQKPALGSTKPLRNDSPLANSCESLLSATLHIFPKFGNAVLVLLLTTFVVWNLRWGKRFSSCYDWKLKKLRLR
jgi:hypothetical protein